MKRNKKKQIKSVIGTLSIAVSLLVNGMGVSVSAAETSETEQKPKTPVVSSDGVTTWDCIYFGNFWQGDTNNDGIVDEKDNKQPIKWRVLSVDGNDAFLMADSVMYVMDDANYDNDTIIIPKWNESPIRKWLNDAFYNHAFTETETLAILEQKIDGDWDAVYIPSQEEMLKKEYGFSEDGQTLDSGRIARMTNYAQNCWYTDCTFEFRPAQCYYLRSYHWSEFYSSWVSNEVHKTGNVWEDGDNSYWESFNGVRPVLHIDLSKNVWTYAGTCASDTEGIKESGNYRYFIYNNEAIILSYNELKKIL